MGVLDFLNTGLQVGAQVLNQINQRKTWEREDNAVQRRVEDLKKAGLSPVLAAGSGASASGPIRVEAPQISRSVEAQNAAIGQTKAQTGLTKQELNLAEQREVTNSLQAQINKNMLDELRRDASNRGTKAFDLANSGLMGMWADNVMKQEKLDEYVRNIGIAKKYAVPSSSSQAMDMIAGDRLVKQLMNGSGEGANTGGASVLLRIIGALGGILK